MSNLESCYEVEFKYRAPHVSKAVFLEAMREWIGEYTAQPVSGTDTYFTSPTSSVVCRKRDSWLSTSFEITAKSKTGEDSTVREETDLWIDQTQFSSKEDVHNRTNNFLKLLGFIENVTITKTGVYIVAPSVVYSYYVVNGVDTYIEIEARKDHNYSNDHALTLITIKEELVLGPLFGLTSKDRLTKNMFELYGDNANEESNYSHLPSSRL